MIDQHEKKIYERKSLADVRFMKVFWPIWLIVTTVLGLLSESGSELTMARIVALSGLSGVIYFSKTLWNAFELTMRCVQFPYLSITRRGITSRFSIYRGLVRMLTKLKLHPVNKSITPVSLQAFNFGYLSISANQWRWQWCFQNICNVKIRIKIS